MERTPVERRVSGAFANRAFLTTFCRLDVLAHVGSAVGGGAIACHAGEEAAVVSRVAMQKTSESPKLRVVRIMQRLP